MSNLEPLGNGFLGTLGKSIYRTLLFIRELRFKIFPPRRFPFPVISVGGISAGGTGKTPLTSTIIDIVTDLGYTPVLFSRGYGRTSKEYLLITPEQECTFTEVGDEPAMLKARHPSVWLAIGSKRVISAQKLLKHLPSRAVAILDDGFQHRYLARDLDIVTLPPTLFNEQLIPAGLLREPLSALQRADLLVPLSDSSFTEEYLDRISLFNKPIITAQITTPYWQDLYGNRLSHLTKPLALFSGIARPQRFISAAKKHSTTITSTTIFNDHHTFSDQEIEKLAQLHLSSYGTTEKDLQRLSTNNRAKLEKLYYLVVTLTIENRTLLESLIASLLRGHYDTSK